MVRKLQILAAAVQIEIAAEQARRHGGAFDVPPGTAVPPGRGPGRLSRLRVLPEHEIQGIELGVIHLYARAGAQVVDLLPREPAVPRELAHRVHDIAVAGDI